MYCYLMQKKLIRLLGQLLLWLPIILLSLFLLILFYILTINITKPILSGCDCYTDRYLGNKLEHFMLDDVLLSERKPRKGKTIFFHETSCSQTGELKLNARQACAIESAALLNPNSDIFVLFASPRSAVQLNESLSKINLYLPNILKAYYKNVYLRNVNLWRYAAGTPSYSWLENGELFNSTYLSSHMSDYLRFLTLWHWGGTYLDLDFILKKTLENYKPNFACAESKHYIAAGVLNFDYYGVGHKIADMCLKNFMDNYSGEIWAHNGPGVITRVLRTICKTYSIEFMTRNYCYQFQVFPTKYFYAIEWWNWTYFFKTEYLQKSLNLTKESIAIHVWNKYSSQHMLQVGSKVAYAVYAEKYCPNIYKSCGKVF